MGYLINPTAMRIGWFQSWNNSFYIENRYYPQLLHIILKFRVYLLYLLNQPQWRNKKWLYNNLIITHDCWGIKAHIYYYDGKLEDGWRNYTEQVFIYKSVVRKYINKQLSQKNYRVHLNSLQDFFTIISILLLYSPLRRSYQLRLGKLMNANLFKHLPLNKPIDEFFSNYKRFKFTSIRVNLFYNLLLNIVQTQFRKPNSVVSRNYKLRSSNMLDIARWYYMIYDTFMGAKPVLKTFAKWMGLVFIHMYNINIKVNVYFYLINNEHITANFLAIYIAQRLKQKYRLNFLINPLLHELKRVKRVSRIKNKHKYSLHQLNTQLTHNYNLYKQNLKYLFGSYSVEHYNLFKKTFSWFTYDLLITQWSIITHIWDIQNLSLIKEYLMEQNDYLRARIFGICRTVSSKRAHILFFVKATYYKLYTSYLLKINKNRTNNRVLKPSPDYFIFVREMYYDLNSSFANISSKDRFDFIFTNINKLPVWYSLRIGLKSLVRLERFTHFMQRRNHIYHTYKISKGTIRRRKVMAQNPHRGLIGYKIQLKGRFTRKQIAAKHVFKGGHVPLNTLNSNIDYGFATVPIKNSAIGVKVWLYRGSYNINNSYMIKIV